MSDLLGIEWGSITVPLLSELKMNSEYEASPLNGVADLSPRHLFVNSKYA